MECLVEGAKDQAAGVEQLRAEWRRLWTEYFDDKVRAEARALQYFEEQKKPQQLQKGERG